MRSFLTLLNKEIRELLTAYTLIPLVITVILFLGLGNVLGKEGERLKSPQPVLVYDQDRSETTRELVEVLRGSNAEVTLLDAASIEEAVATLRASESQTLIAFPSGLEAALGEALSPNLSVYSRMRSFSQSGAIESGRTALLLQAMNEYASDKLLLERFPGTHPGVLKQPLLPAHEHVLVGSRETEIGFERLFTFLSSQIFFIPIILFMVIMFAAQMIATSVATEKENKTLETLLAAPVSRHHLVASKLLAAGAVALLYALAYMFAMRQYFEGITGGAGQPADTAAAVAARQLGLTFGSADYLLLGLSLFFGILCALAAAMILGTFADDVKSVQNLIAPFSFLIAIPYFLVLFLDLTKIGPGMKLLVHAIPFSHPFLAPQYLWQGQYLPVIYGILYQLFVFLACVSIAAWIFSTDRIVTIRLNFKKPQLHLGRRH